MGEKWALGVAKFVKNLPNFGVKIKNFRKLGSSELEHNATGGVEKRYLPV